MDKFIYLYYIVYFFDDNIKRNKKNIIMKFMSLEIKLIFITINSLKYYHGLDVSREYSSAGNNRIETTFNKYFF